MLRTANIATFPSREHVLIKMLNSIRGQFDKVRIYYNNVYDRPNFLPDWVEVVCGGDTDLTDNGKFYFIKDNEYYFTLDDDLIYPPTYADDMVSAIDRLGGMVSHHGRILLNSGAAYYRNHKVFRCLGENRKECKIDVVGSGVAAFDTTNFKPVIWNSEYQKMGDLVLSLEAARMGVSRYVLKHKADYFGYLNPDPSSTIYFQESKNDKIQSQLADEIIALK